jgi:uncharacterized MAPEG superfamily protein
MGSELGILALYGLWVIITIFAQVLVGRLQVGDWASFSPRDEIPKLVGKAGRMERAQLNSVVAMALFAPAILILQAKGGFTSGTLLASQLFLIARVVYVPLYFFGVPVARTLAWMVGILATAYLFYVGL